MFFVQKAQVLLKDIRLYGFHGVLPQERAVGAYYILNIGIGTDFSRAVETDELDGTISYAAAYEVVKAEMAVSSSLLEHVAGRICEKLFARFPEAQNIHLDILKENPPMGADCKGAGISMEAERAHRS